MSGLKENIDNKETMNEEEESKMEVVEESKPNEKTDSSVKAEQAVNPNALCNGCNRTTAKVQEQNDDPNLLPYGSCEACKLALYLEPDKDYVETCIEGGNVLTGDCFNQDWDRALERVRLFPKEAVRIRGYKSNSALHWAAYFKAPRNLIEALVQAAPKESSIPGDGFYDNTPLQIVMCVNEQLTEETMQIIKLLVEADVDGLGAKNEFGNNAFDTAWKKCGAGVQMSLKKKVNPDPHPFLYKDDASVKDQEKFEKLWNLVCLMARAIRYKSTDVESGPILHALFANLQSSTNALRFGIKLYSDQLLKPDPDGNTPLHLITAMIKPERQDSPFEGYDSEEEYMPEKIKYNRDYQSKASFLTGRVKLLLKDCPAAAGARNQEGMLPIHNAIRTRKKWNGTIDNLVEAYPLSLEARDPESCLFPFMLAATLCLEDDSCDCGFVPPKETGDPDKDSGSGNDSDSDSYYDDYDDDNFCTCGYHIGNLNGVDSPPSAAAQSLTVVYGLLRACPELGKFGNWLETDAKKKSIKRPASIQTGRSLRKKTAI